MPPAATTVELCHLTKRFGAVVAVDDLTVSLAAGTVTGLVGPNGAGKTTVLRLLLGLMEPTSGHSRIRGRPYRDLDGPLRHVGAVLGAADFHPGRRARDHLRVLAAAGGLPAGRVDAVVDLVGLGAAARRPVKHLSLGQRQRLGLAGALLGEPAVLVLDEPANGLDPVGARWLRRYLRQFADGGGTALVSSHLLAELALTVDRVVVIDRGRVVADAGVDDLAGPGRSLEDAYLELTGGGAP